MKTLTLCLFAIFSFYACGAQVNVIVKFKSDVVYTINYTSGTITSSSVALADAINKASVRKIISLYNPNSKRAAELKSVNLIRHIHFFQLDSLADIDQFVKALRQTNLFEYVEKDQKASGSGVAGIVPNDGYFGRQWSYHNNGTFNSMAIPGADVDMEDAWGITTGSSSTIVCILDTGFKLDHPETLGRIWTNTGEVPGNGVDDDSNGYIDDTGGWDWVNNDANPSDDYGHGTNVAGIIGTTGNNGIGYAGVNWNCKLMIGKVLDNNNSGTYTWMINGIYYAVTNGANIVNMSIGGSGFSQALKDVCDFADSNDVAIFACMMNFNNSTPYYPAAFASTIAVGATDVNDYRVQPFFWSTTSGSNYGPHIDLVAPGNYIYGLSYTSSTNYNTYWGGTSQATPLVAGVASLIHALKPTVTVEGLRTILRTTAQDLVGRPTEDTPGWDQYMGAGRMDAFAALQYTLSTLPAHMSNLSGSMQNGKSLLNWKTYEEMSTNYFGVEHSSDAVSWQQFGVVNTGNHSSTDVSYSFTDHHPLSGVNYYRVKQVKKDGKFEYTNVLKLVNGIRDIEVKVISPFASSLQLFISSAEETKIQIQLFTTTGTLVSKQTELISAGITPLVLNTASLSKGAFTLVIADGDNQVLNRKVVKQ